MTGVITKVTFPLFSEVQDDPERMKNGFKKAIRAIALVNFPMMFGLMATAGPLVLTLLGEKWRPAIPYLQLLAIVGLFNPLSAVNLNILLAKGRSDLFFRLEIIKKTIALAEVGADPAGNRRQRVILAENCQCLKMVAGGKLLHVVGNRNMQGAGFPAGGFFRLQRGPEKFPAAGHINRSRAASDW
jgi:hypothetical protein